MMTQTQIATEIQRAARTVAQNGRAYIYSTYLATGIEMSPRQFKDTIVALRRAGLIRLSRCDLRAAADQRLLGLGRTIDAELGVEFDFIVTE